MDGLKVKKSVFTTNYIERPFENEKIAGYLCTFFEKSTKKD